MTISLGVLILVHFQSFWTVEIDLNRVISRVVRVLGHSTLSGGTRPPNPRPAPSRCPWDTSGGVPDCTPPKLTVVGPVGVPEHTQTDLKMRSVEIGNGYSGGSTTTTALLRVSASDFECRRSGGPPPPYLCGQTCLNLTLVDGGEDV